MATMLPSEHEDRDSNRLFKRTDEMKKRTDVVE